MLGFVAGRKRNESNKWDQFLIDKRDLANTIISQMKRIMKISRIVIQNYKSIKDIDFIPEMNLLMLLLAEIARAKVILLMQLIGCFGLSFV